MVRVVIYGEHKEETEGLEGMLRAILTENKGGRSSIPILGIWKAICILFGEIHI